MTMARKVVNGMAILRVYASRPAKRLISASRRLVALAVLLGAATLMPPGMLPAHGDDTACRVIRIVGNNILKHCGNEVRSMTLSLREVKRGLASDRSGRFSFPCPIEHMCEGEPDVWGWFIDETPSRAGARDEAAIRLLLRNAPIIMTDDSVKPTCAVSTVDVAGLESRSMCFELTPESLHVVVVVGAGEDIGFLLMFAQRGLGSELLREKVSAITPKFILQRATGDAGLLKWLR
jgi:hypothetical protein